jgi:hypothetical protein
MKNPGNKALVIGGVSIAPGKTRNVKLKFSETYFGESELIHLRVIRAKQPGPTVFVTAAIHGDELNGTGIVHELMARGTLKLTCGTVILVPVVNVLGFESNIRYLPDRRDLNRCFPGAANGSMAGRVAHMIFNEVVAHCDYGIDLHTAAIQRTNFPNIRADLRDEGVREIAEAFGCEMLVNGKGPDNSFRREATRHGCPTITVEAGEPWKIESAVLDLGVRGVRNVLIHLGMMEGKPYLPPYQIKVFKTQWVRAQLGGILRFHVAPGQPVEKGEAIASNFTIMGKRQSMLYAPFSGVIVGMTTMPTVKPGEPVCHIARAGKSIAAIKRKLKATKPSQLHHQLRDNMASNFSVVISSETEN